MDSIDPTTGEEYRGAPAYIELGIYLISQILENFRFVPGIYREKLCVFPSRKRFFLNVFRGKLKQISTKNQENMMKNMFSVQKHIFFAPQARKTVFLKGIPRKIWVFFHCPGIYLILRIWEIFGNVPAYIYKYMTVYPCNCVESSQCQRDRINFR